MVIHILVTKHEDGTCLDARAACPFLNTDDPYTTQLYYNTDYRVSQNIFK